ncbi:MAG: PEGA domain-containing protein [Phycisphaerales bacterium]|nr:PEGA domain-containing protein [Phycisphaerales bacterium]
MPVHVTRLAGLLLVPVLVGGCLQRRVHITSEPSGALVVVNDVEVGHTPCDMDFTFYGTYDVLLRKDGYEPLRTARQAQAPWYEYPGLDLVATAIPANIDTTLDWHFELEPALETTMERDAFEASLLERARDLRDQAALPTTDLDDAEATDDDRPDDATSDDTSDDPAN